MKIEMLWHHQLDFMRKVVGYTQTLELLINLQPDHRRLAGRGLERRPRPSAGGPQGRLAAPRRKRGKPLSPASSLSRLQLNDISLFFDVFEKAQDVVHIRTADMPLLMRRDRDALASLTGFTAKNK